jgi:AraC family transcriptional regulator, L-rhamnose operon transcriptional activator RhaR
VAEAIASTLLGAGMFRLGHAPLSARRHRHGNIGAHDHDFIEVAIVLDGHGTHHCATGQHEVARGDVLVLRPGAWHGYRTRGRLELFNCCFAASLLSGELAWVRSDPRLNHLLWTGPTTPGRRGVMRLAVNEGALRRVEPYLDDLARSLLRRSHIDKAGEIARLALCLTELAAAVHVPDDAPARPLPPAHRAVQSAIQLLESDIARSWTLGDLSRLLHVDKFHLVRLFKAHVGLPPLAFHARCRAERAALLLLRSDDPIKQIGQQVGWPDQNYFARRFRAHFGTSPRAYRAQYRSY